MSKFLIESFEPINSLEEFKAGLEEYLKFINSNEDGNKKLEETLGVIRNKNDFNIYKLNIAYTNAVYIAGKGAARFFFQVLRFGVYDVSLYPVNVLYELVPLYTKYNQIFVCADLYHQDPIGFAGVDIFNSSDDKDLLRFQRADYENFTISFNQNSLIALSEQLLDLIIDKLHSTEQTLSPDDYKGFIISLERLAELVGEKNVPDDVKK